MTPTQAASLAAFLSRKSPIRVFVERDRIVFSGATTGDHSLDVAASTFERVTAHWQGYAAQPNPFEVGARVTFRRGMFGLWAGTIAHVGTQRDGAPYFLIAFTRKNGSKSKRRITLDGIGW